ncbi:AAA family ATPase [Fusobacterium polymorphum]
MIKKITMHNVASYRNTTSLETDKKINLLYGLNGTGKSTLSNFLYNRYEPRFKDCSIDGLKASDEILVYNQQFIRDNFYETDDIPGIFTLSKENKEIKKVIEEAKKYLDELLKERNNLDEENNKNISEYEKEVQDYQNEIWKIKTEFTGGDRVLEFCLDGLKSSKNTLFNYLITLDKNFDETNYNIKNLIKEADELKLGGVKESPIEIISTDIDTIEKSELLKKVIVGNKNSTVAGLIEILNNSDWVSKGIAYVDKSEEPTLCPFCQQKTITKELIREMEEYFNKSYQQDKNALNDLLKLYLEKTSNIISIIEILKNNRFLENNKKDVDIYLLELKKIIEKNTDTLRKKIDAPSMVVILETFEELIQKINTIIKNANEMIVEYNKKIENINESKIAIKRKFWKLMRTNFDAVINIYNKKKKEKEDYEKQYTLKKKIITEKIEKQELIIKENLKKTINIDEAIDNIKITLLDIGITDFAIEKYSDEEALYHLKRKEHTENNVFQTLSEGEKMVISFLYFLERCKGNTKGDSTSENKIIVIDDPISSLSHIYIFNIGRLIHNEFLRTNKYEQIFILTHSLYFFYELTNINHKEREETQRLFRIFKNDKGSSLSAMKYEEIQNDYQAYWHIIKDENQSPALIANCMRNIIEYFFNFVEKQDYNNVFQKQELQQKKFMAFNRYMNRESHSKGQNIFDIKEFDYSDFKKAFELLFIHTGYSEHYNKMMK